MVRIHAPSIAALAAAFAMPALLSAQPSQPAPGQLVRVTAREAGLLRETATLVAVGPDTLVVLRTLYVAHGSVLAPDTVRTRIALDAVQRLEVRSSGRSYAGLGFVAGGVAGAVAGASIGRHSGYSRCGFWFVFCIEESPGDKATLYGILGAGIGAGVGALLGSLPAMERWRRVTAERLHVALAPEPGGAIGIRVSLAW